MFSNKNSVPSCTVPLNSCSVPNSLAWQWPSSRAAILLMWSRKTFKGCSAIESLVLKKMDHFTFNQIICIYITLAIILFKHNYLWLRREQLMVIGLMHFLWACKLLQKNKRVTQPTKSFIFLKPKPQMVLKLLKYLVSCFSHQFPFSQERKVLKLH